MARPSVRLPVRGALQVSQAVQRGIRFLSAAQAETGEFPTYWSRQLNMSDATYVESPFLTGMVLLSLAEVPGPEVHAIRRKSISYLRTKRKENGYFAFFDHGIDCDLDDTCLLNWLLQQQDSNQTFYLTLARAVASQAPPSGWYGTWVRADAHAANDLDPCVNVNIVRFLHHNGFNCRRTIRALKQALGRGDHRKGTLYYESGWTLLYLIFTLPPGLRNAIIDPSQPQFVKLVTPGEDSSLLDTAMGLFIMSSCAGDSRWQERQARRLLEAQNPDGSWVSWACFRAFNYWGSRELTTGIVIQALWRFNHPGPISA